MIFIVALPVFVVLVLQCQKLELYHDLENRFAKKEMVQLTLPLEKITWIKRNKELLLDGRMFDVKYFSYNLNSVIVTGFFDEEEDAVDRQISEHLSHKKQSKTGIGIWKLVHLFQGGPTEICVISSYLNNSKPNYPPFIPALLFHSLKPTTPPPLV